MSMRFLLRVIKNILKLIVMIAQLCEYSKKLQIVHFKCVNCKKTNTNATNQANLY